MFCCGALLIILSSIVAISNAAGRSRGGAEAGEEFMHQRPDQQKSSPGWQEPGLWRPKWVMEREFVEQRSNGSEVVVARDRLYFRLKSDRTVKIFSQKSRPLLEWRRKAPREDEKKKKLFEASGSGGGKGSSRSKQEEVSQTQQLQTFRAEQEALFESDGAWWWAEDVPPSTARVKIETKEGPERERIRHETRCEWGKMDGYAAKFRTGSIFKYKGLKAVDGAPVGSYRAGSFLIRPTAHRPLLSKEFQAFQ